MNSYFFEHNWKQLKRSPDRHKSIAVNILFGLFFVVGMLNLLLIGYFINRALREDIAPGRNPVDVLSGFLLYYFIVDAAFRLWFQKIHTAQVKTYLLLNIRRNSIANYLLSKTVFSWFNLLPLPVFIPFAIKEAGRGFSPGGAAIWLATIFMLMLMSGYFCNYLKTRFASASKVSAPLFIAAATSFGLNYYNMFSIQSVSSYIFSSVIRNPIIIVIPVGLLAIAYFLNYKYLTEHFYPCDLISAKKTIQRKERFKFLNSMGTAGHIMSLDLKMLVRNKRNKYVIWLSFIMVFYGLLLRPQETATSDFMLMFICVFTTGFFILSYGSVTYSVESTYIGILVTSPLEIRDFLKAKLNMMYFFTLATYILSLFYVIFGYRFILVNSAMFLYNIGINSFIVLFMATFNKKRYVLSSEMFSQQGKDTFQYFIFFVIMAIQCAIFFPVKYALSGDYAFITLGAFGMLGLFLKEQFIRVLVSQFNARKYIMIEGIKNSN